jgi:hypothetical protein
MWSALPNTQRRVKTLRYSLCDDRWSIAPNLKKIFFFVSVLHLAVHGRSNTPPVVTATLAAVGVSSHGLYLKSIGDCSGCRGESINTPLDPLHFGWTISLSYSFIGPRARFNSFV